MPYIAQKDRAELDAAIENLAQKIVEVGAKESYDAAFAGLLNYSATRVALLVLRRRFGKIRYWMIATVSGTFHNVADEFYRRLAAPYEDRKIAEEGDVDLYKEYVDEITK